MHVLLNNRLLGYQNGKKLDKKFLPEVRCIRFEFRSIINAPRQVSHPPGV